MPNPSPAFQTSSLIIKGTYPTLTSPPPIAVMDHPSKAPFERFETQLHPCHPDLQDARTPLPDDVGRRSFRISRLLWFAFPCPTALQQLLNTARSNQSWQVTSSKSPAHRTLVFHVNYRTLLSGLSTISIAAFLENLLPERNRL